MSNAVITSAARSGRSSAGFAARLRRWAATVAAMMDTWDARVRQRRHLRTLDDHMLKDIGLTRGEVIFESRKLPWQC